MTGKYELKKGSTGKYGFNLKAGNGQVILTSQRYESKSSAENGIASVQQNGPLEERFERRESIRNEPYFVLKAGNGQIIGTSEMYSSDSAMENGIDSVKKNSPTSRIDDLTTG